MCDLSSIISDNNHSYSGVEIYVNRVLDSYYDNYNTEVLELLSEFDYGESYRDYFDSLNEKSEIKGNWWNIFCFTNLVK